MGCRKTSVSVSWRIGINIHVFGQEEEKKPMVGMRAPGKQAGIQRSEVPI